MFIRSILKVVFICNVSMIKGFGTSKQILRGFSLGAAGKGFSQDHNEHSNLDKAGSQKILSIPSMEELTKSDPLTKLKVIQDNLYGGTSKDDTKKVFKDIVQFPTPFMIKVIGEKSPSFVTSVVAVVAEVLAVPQESIAVSTRDSGKYIRYSVRAYHTTHRDRFNPYALFVFASVSISPVFNNSDELYLCYEVTCLIY